MYSRCLTYTHLSCFIVRTLPILTTLPMYIREPTLPVLTQPAVKQAPYFCSTTLLYSRSTQLYSLPPCCIIDTTSILTSPPLYSSHPAYTHCNPPCLKVSTSPETHYHYCNVGTLTILTLMLYSSSPTILLYSRKYITVAFLVWFPKKAFGSRVTNKGPLSLFSEGRGFIRRACCFF